MLINFSGRAFTVSQCHLMAYSLQGFWDMVNFQVEDLYRKFSNLADMERNDWKLLCQSPEKEILQV